MHEASRTGRGGSGLSAAPARPARLDVVAVAAASLALAVLLQRAAHAYTAEFYGDEASHYVTGLLVHDYVRAGFPGSPLAFLKAFHSHYPVVGIGHWPPLYYAAEGAWMLLFSPARASLLMFSAVLTAATAAILYAAVAGRFGRPAGLWAALAFVALPIVQIGTGEVMLDNPVALLCLVAAVLYGRYLDTGRAAYSLGFGVAAAAALMTKGNAGCLALLPPFAVLLGRRFELLRRASFWLPVPVVALLAGPWYAVTYGAVAQGFFYSWGLDYLWAASWANLRTLLGAAGPLVVAAAAIALVRLAAGRLRETGAVAAAALLLAVWVFQGVVPSGLEGRYMAPAVPPLLILALYGLDWAAALVPARRRAAGAAALAVLTLSVLPAAAKVPVKPSRGFTEAAQAVWAHRVAGNPVVLVAVDGGAEASVVAELALLDPARPSLFAVRGSRLLGGGAYRRQDYVPKFDSAAATAAEMDRYAIPFVLYSSAGGPGAWEHLRQLAEDRRLAPERWRAVYQDSRHQPAIGLFEIGGNDRKQAEVARLLALSAPKSLE